MTNGVASYWLDALATNWLVRCFCLTWRLRGWGRGPLGQCPPRHPTPSPLAGVLGAGARESGEKAGGGAWARSCVI